MKTQQTAQTLPILKLDIIYIPSNIPFITHVKQNVQEGQEYIASAFAEVKVNNIYPVITVDKIRNSNKILIRSLRKVQVTDIIDGKAQYKRIYHTGVEDIYVSNILKNKLITNYDELRKKNLMINKLILDASCSLTDIIAQITHIIQTRCIKCFHIVQEILEQNNDHTRVDKTIACIEIAIQSTIIENEAIQDAAESIKKKNNDFIITEQIKALQDKLSTENQQSGLKMIKDKYNKKKKDIPLDIQKRIESLLHTLEKEYFGDSRTNEKILEILINFPYNVPEYQKYNIEDVILQTGTFGNMYRDIMTYIMEQLNFNYTMSKLNKNYKPEKISLCIVGGAGTGKTTVCKILAKYLQKEYMFISLGGLRDANVIKGFKKTYRDSGPGEFARQLSLLKNNAPIIVWDEVDKLSTHNGQREVEAVLLNLFDESGQFQDDYLEICIDTSHHINIFTANNIENIGPQLFSRLKFIYMPPYSITDKVMIAKWHIEQYFKEIEMHPPVISDQMITDIIIQYTREPGVRELIRRIKQILVKYINAYDKNNKHITKERISTYLPAKEMVKPTKLMKNIVGLVNGLAYTSTGSGMVLPIEVIILLHNKDHIITGNVKKIMQESCFKGPSLVDRTREEINEIFGCKIENINNISFHINTPTDSTMPKDGPSAGIAIYTALVLALTNHKLTKYIAMTGEITLNKQIYSVGGVEQKVEAAVLGGAQYIILPDEGKEKYNLEKFTHGKKIVDDKPKKQEICIKYMSNIKQLLHFIHAHSKEGNHNDELHVAS